MEPDDRPPFLVVRSDTADADLALIFDHLTEAYLAFGEAVPEATDRAGARLFAIQAAMEAMGRTPYQGTLCPEIADGLRRVTKDRAIFYFDIDDAGRTIRILAVFFGGQDHVQRMLDRLTD